MTDFGALTMVGLIATVLSIGFALAAFINSRRRMANKQKKSQEDPPGLPFLAPGKQASKSDRTTPSTFYATASRQVSGGHQTKPAFKQVQALGAQSGPIDSSNTDEYLWE